MIIVECSESQRSVGHEGYAGPRLLIRKRVFFPPRPPRGVIFPLPVLDYLGLLYWTQLRNIYRCLVVKLHRQIASHRTTARFILPSGERHKTRPRLLSVRITECEWHAWCFCFFLAYLYPIHQLWHVRVLAAGVQVSVVLDEASNEVHEQRGCLCRRSRQRNRRRL